VVDGDVIRALFAAFTRRDVNAALALVADDFEFWPQGTARRVDRELPYRGSEGLQRYFDDVALVWEHLEIEPQSISSVSGGCTAFGVAHGRTVEGEEIRASVIWVFRLRDGRVQQAKAIPTGETSVAAGQEPAHRHAS
jgi:ketosteroid isomerase-like protein